MSQIYLAVPKNFKDDTLGGQYRPRSVGSREYDISKVLEQVITALFQSQFAVVRSSVLCLVNAWAPDNNMSIGYSRSPDEAVLLPYSGLIFTFSIRPRPVKNLPYPQFINGRSKHWRTWGADGINEYITIGVSKSTMFGLDGHSLDLLNVLYNAVGVITRNHFETFKNQRIMPNIVNQDVSTLRSLYHGQSVRRAVSSVPYAEWQYVRYMWQRHSSWLLPKFFPQDFPLYYVLYLNEWLYAPELSVVARQYVDKNVVDYVAKGLLSLSTSLSTKQPPSGDEIVAALYLLLKDKDLSDLESGQVSRTNFIRRFYLGLSVAMQTPEFSAALVRYAMSNHYTMARDLVAGYYNDQLKNLISYLNLIEV